MTNGVVRTETVLDRILERTAEDLALRRTEVPESDLERAIAAMVRTPISLAEALAGERVGVIAEFKRGSPSRGVFPVAIEPTDVAAAYHAGGAAAISCLTDWPFFHGSRADLEAVAATVHARERLIPVLRKDFMIDRYQMLEARAWGADVVLLIVAALDDALLRSLHDDAASLGLSVLVEVHDEAELERALRLETPVIGVNNRDLRTFKVDLDVTRRVAAETPEGVTLVSESGIVTAEHVDMVAGWGAGAVLVGESLILQEDRVAAVTALANVPRQRT